MTQRTIVLLLLLALLITACDAGAPPPAETAQITPALAATSPAALDATQPPTAALPLQATHTPSATATASATRTPAPTPTASATPAPPAEPLAGIEVDDARDIALSADAGAHWLRINALHWAAVEAVEGSLDWAGQGKLEAQLLDAAQRNMQVILIVRDTPAWAQKYPGVPCGPVSAEKLAAFGEFMAAAVARYSAPPYNVLYWELGNEPDAAREFTRPVSPYGCWGEVGVAGYGGGYYAEMLKIVSPMIKAANAQAQVLVGGLLLGCDPVNPPLLNDGSGNRSDCSSSTFLTGILENGGAPFFDGVSFHVYDYYYGVKGQWGNTSWNSGWNTTGPSLAAKTSYLRAVLNAYGAADKYLLNTEIAVLCGKLGDEPLCLHPDFLDTKADYAVQAQTQAAALGLRGYVWYSLNGWRSSGLVDRWLNPLDVYRAFAFNAQMLLGAAYWGEVKTFAGARVYEFYRGAERIWIAWSVDGETLQITLDAAPQQVYDRQGQPLAVSETLALTSSPVYLVWTAP